MKLLAISALLSACHAAPTHDSTKTGMITFLAKSRAGCLNHYTVKGSTSKIVGTAFEASTGKGLLTELGTPRIISETNQNYRIEIRLPRDVEHDQFMPMSLAMFLGAVDKNFAPGTWTAHVQFVDADGKPKSMKPNRNFPTGIPSAALYSHASKILENAYYWSICRD